MAIKFCCPNCKKALRAREEQAGKKVRCPGCQRILTLTAGASHSEEIESLAAAALAEQPAAAAPVEQSTIKFHCFYCDEEVEVTADLAGKQTPCTHCRRIIKVPLLVKKEPRDWRKVDPRKPGAGLLRDAEAPPEGAWGSTSSRNVSRQALVEADVIPVAVERLSTSQWVVRILIGTAAVLLLGVGGYIALHLRAQSNERQALDRALEFVSGAPTQGLDELAAAEICRGAGEYYLRAGDGKAARDWLGKARARLTSVNAASPARDSLAIDMVLNLMDLGARTKTEVADGSRVDSGELAGRDIRQTLALIDTHEGRALAVRIIGRKLAEHNELARMESCVRYMNLKPGKEQTEILALVALVLEQADQKTPAANLAEKLIKPYEEKPGKKTAEGLPAMGPHLIALVVARDEAAKVGKNLPKLPAAGKPIDPDVRIGYVEGRSYQGNWAESFATANRPGTPAQRVEALVMFAERAIEKQPEEARKAVENAVAVLEKEHPGKTLSPWVVYQLAHVAARIGLADRLDPIAREISDPALRARALIEIARTRDPASGDALEQAVHQGEHPLLVEFLARQYTHRPMTSSLFQQVGTWSVPSLQPFGYLGIALGEQDG